MDDESKKGEPKVQADNNGIAVGGISIGGNVGDIRIGHTIGYTAEEVSVLITQIKSTFQPKPFDERCPYKGLDVFEEEDAELFFGRERLVEDLVSRVKESRTVFITGPSGSGKSSLVRAGLIHALKQGAIKNSERWLYETMKPGRDPIGELGRVSSSLAGSTNAEDEIRAKAMADGTIFARWCEIALKDSREKRAIIFIDQFEEVFTQINKEEERVAFLNLLTHAATVENGRVILLFSMRSDFVSNCAIYPQLNAMLNQQFIQIGAMQPDELVSAIAQPALRVGLHIDPDLIAQVINDMKGEPGALPLMQFTLKDLFDARQAKGGLIALTLNDYIQRGGIQKSLERHADAAFAKLGNNEQELARAIFGGLIEIGRGIQDTRRTALFDELIPSNAKAADIEVVIQKLADARLITTGENTVTLAHEKLIDAWPWLKKLVNENRDVITLQNEIAADAKEWDEHKRDSSYLYSGARLGFAQEQVTAKRIRLNLLAKGFIDEGINAREAERKTKESSRRRVTSGLISGIVVALVLAGFAFYQLFRAQEQAKIIQARTNELKNLAVIDQANQLLKQGNPDLALALAMHATAAEGPLEKAYAGLLDAAYLSLSRKVFHLCEQNDTRHTWATTVNINSNNKLAAVGCSSNELSDIYVFDLQTGNTQMHWSYPAWIFSLTFSPDGQSILAGYADAKAILWQLDGTPKFVFAEHISKVSTVAFSPDGSTIVTASYDKSIILWDAHTGNKLNRISGDTVIEFKGKFTSANYSPDGKAIALGDDAGNVLIWDYMNGPIYYSRLQDKHQNFVLSVEFSPDGSKIVSSSADSSIVLWKFDGSLQKINTLDISKYQPGVWVRSVRFLPNGSELLAALSDGTILLWDIHSLQVIQRLGGHHGEVESLSVSSDGDFAISGARDGEVRFWDLRVFESLADIGVSPTFQGNFEINSMKFTDDGKQLIGGAANGYVYILDTNTKSIIDSWMAYPNQIAISEIALTPDNSKLITAGSNGQAILWNLNNHQLITEFSKIGSNMHTTDISPDGKIAIVGYTNGEITLVSLIPGEDTQSCTLNGHTNSVNSVRFSPNGKFAVSGANDYTVIMWDLATCKKQGILFRHDSWVTALAFSPDGKLLASASGDGTLIVWNLDSGQQMYRLRLTELDTNSGLDAFALSIDFSPDGRLLSASYANGNVAIWSATNGILLRKFIAFPTDTCTYGTHCFWALNVRFLLCCKDKIN